MSNTSILEHPLHYTILKKLTEERSKWSTDMEQSIWSSINKFLNSQFEPTSSFTVCPTSYLAGEDNCVWASLCFTIEYHNIPLLWIGVEPLSRLSSGTNRRVAYRNIVNKLGDFVSIIPKDESHIYGISFFGSKYNIISVERSTYEISPCLPILNYNNINRDVPLIEWWSNDIQDIDGAQIIIDLFNKIKLSYCIKNLS